MVQFWLQNCAHFPVCTRYQREGQFCLRSTITPKLTEEGTAAKSELRSGITDLWQMRKFPSSALNLVSRIALRYRFNGDFIRVEGFVRKKRRIVQSYGGSDKKESKTDRGVSHHRPSSITFLLSLLFSVEGALDKNPFRLLKTDRNEG